MTRLDSIEKLREAGRYADESGHTLAHAMCIPLNLDGVTNLEVAHAFADEIQAEIDSRYMELPVDADGVPIHVGDTLQLGDTRGEVVALTYCPSNGKLSWEWQCDTGDWYNTAFAYHLKPRTVEDVLRDFAIACEDAGFAGPDVTRQINKFAAELQMRGDEE